VCRLKTTLYGIKQAPRAWYGMIDGYLMSLGFIKNVVDLNLYYKIVNGKSLILVLYVDDLFLTDTESLIVECKYALAYEFEMRELGMMHYLLGLEVWQRTDDIFLSQGKYIDEILKKFGMLKCKRMATPMVTNLKKLSVSSFDSDEIDLTLYRQMIGSLMYLVNTKPDIFYALSALSQFMSQSRQRYYIVAKHVLRYLRGIVGHGLRYTSSIDMILQGYIDSYWAGIAVDKKRTFEC
jgi:hypothetical protein